MAKVKGGRKACRSFENPWEAGAGYECAGQGRVLPRGRPRSGRTESWREPLPLALNGSR
jgi:hypothetical protein